MHGNFAADHGDKHSFESARIQEVKKAINRERILNESIRLFNVSGVVAISTNHIASALKISPGNLYFHFRNKEEIIRELFDRMSEEIYALWRSKKGLETYGTPQELIEGSFEVFWRFRFFHREMYHMRRKDPGLASQWRSHMTKTNKLLTATYRYWVETNVMMRIENPAELKMINDLILTTSSSFLQFFESPERPATRRPVRLAAEHILRLLLPYYTETARANAVGYLSQ